jgi:3-deoxy-D-manno-octulosonic-acid transferase
LFADALAAGQAQVIYVPFEVASAVRGVVHHFQPRCALMTEIDTWPVLLTTLRRLGVPLAIANAQYPRKSIERDQKWWGLRSGVFEAYELVMCKSETHAARFRAVGCPRVEVVGETRFDLPVSPQQLARAAERVQAWGLQAGQRPVLCIASAIIGEDEQFLDAWLKLKARLLAAGRPAPLLVYVPRSPQRFDTVFEMFQTAGVPTVRRSQWFDAQLALTDPAATLDGVDVLLGDSLGEMYFYLALSQVVVVGASFVPLGAHNVIEPLALKKPVMVGHSIWGIEYPGVEALAAGVLQQHMTIDSLVDALATLLISPQAYAQAQAGCEAFFAEHAGSTAKHMAVLRPWLAARP